MGGRCFYFPAYEIVLDELRDYRFYAADMLHPSEVAVEYIWERFFRSLFPCGNTKLHGRMGGCGEGFCHTVRYILNRRLTGSSCVKLC